MIRCPLCGLEFIEKDAAPGCGSCPLYAACGKLMCPRCGYEIPKEPGVIRWLKTLMKRKKSSATMR